jgi:hypothetical protein
MLSRLEAMAMDVVGNPYILRQDNIPIRFISTKDDSLEWEEVKRAESLRDAIEHGMLSAKDRQEGVTIDQKIAEVLETGYIEPAIVVADRKKSYGGLLANRFDDGGIKDTWKPQYWFTPEYEGSNLKEAIFKAYDDGLEGKNITIIDEVGRSGSTLDIAREIILRHRYCHIIIRSHIFFGHLHEEIDILAILSTSECTFCI